MRRRRQGRGERCLRQHFLRRMHTDASIFFAPVLKLHHAINQGKKRVVPPDTDIEPRFECRPTLPYQDATGAYRLSGKALHSKAFADAVASIGGAALPFFVCHTVAPTRCPLRSEAGTRRARYSALETRRTRCSARETHHARCSARG